MKNRKGFTMIELLVTITILAVIMTIGVMGVSNLFSNAHKKYNLKQQQLVASAAQEYFSDNKGALPTVYSETKTIKLLNLINGKYITTIRDASGKICSNEDSYIRVTKTGKNRYDYEPILKCGNNVIGDDGTAQPAETLVDAVFDYSKYSKVFDGNVWLTSQIRQTKSTVRYYTNDKIVVKVNLSGKRITAYKYVVNKIMDGSIKKYKESEEKQIDSDNYRDTIVLDTKHYKDGIYEIQIFAYNGRTEYNGNLKSNKIVIDTKPPKCIIKLDGTKGDHGWYRSDNVKVKLSMNEMNPHLYSLLAGATKPEKSYLETSTVEVFKEQGNTEGTKYWADVEDRAGNIGNCDSVHFKVDKDAPKCSVPIDREKDGKNGWYITKPRTSLTEEEVGPSGMADRGLIENETNPTYNGITSGEQNDTHGSIWYGYVKDQAGNEGKCETSEALKVDTVDPVCTVTLDGTKGDHDWYKERKVNIALNITETGSMTKFKDLSINPKTIDMSIPVKDRNISYNGIDSDQQGNTPNSGITWYGYVEDTSGRIGQCHSVENFKVDIDRPDCDLSYTKAEPDGLNDWYITNVQVDMTSKSDTGGNSGLSEWMLTTNGTTPGLNTYNNQVTKTQGETSGTTWYCHARDYAGNTYKKNLHQIKVDTTNPTCSITPPNGNNGWYKSYTPLLNLGDYDRTSGIMNYGLTTNSSLTYNSIRSEYQNDTSGVWYYGYVQDYSGRTGSCSQYVKVDTQTPRCSLSRTSYTPGNYYNMQWYKSSQTVYLDSYYDYGPSGISSSGLTSSLGGSGPTYASQGNTSSGGVVWSCYAYDQAGNYYSDSLTRFGVDDTNPKCTPDRTVSGATNTSEADEGWTNGNVRVFGKCSDYESGCRYTESDLPKEFTSNTNTTYSPGKVEDIAGNTSTCSSYPVKIDKTAPTCSVTINGTKKNDWYNSSGGGPSASTTCSDTGGSGTNGCGVKTGYKDTTFDTPVYDSTSAKYVNDGFDRRAICYTKDKAGNVVRKEGKTIDVDTHAPIISFCWAVNKSDDYKYGFACHSLQNGNWHQINHIAVPRIKDASKSDGIDGASNDYSGIDDNKTVTFEISNSTSSESGKRPLYNDNSPRHFCINTSSSANGHTIKVSNLCDYAGNCATNAKATCSTSGGNDSTYTSITDFKNKHKCTSCKDAKYTCKSPYDGTQTNVPGSECPD